jgi:uncharacterized protein (TIGR02145 family)
MRKNIKQILIISTVLFILVGCKNDNPTFNDSKPHINSFSPSTACLGETININGSNFGTYISSNSVFINEYNIALPLFWSDTLIKIVITKGITSGKLFISANKVQSNAIDIMINKDMVKIGNQIWMVKNLNTDHYRNGDSIPEVRDPKQWIKLTTGAWCYYDNDTASDSKYGKLYNWYALNDPRGLAPLGWHIPTDQEWNKLETSLGGPSVAGGKLKSTGTVEAGDGLWLKPNTGATNESGFSANPVGSRSSSGLFYYLSNRIIWWSSTNVDSESSWSRYLEYDNAYIHRNNYHPVCGFSVRCVRD